MLRKSPILRQHETLHKHETYPDEKKRDTIAAVLSYAFYHLSAHQSYQTQLYNALTPIFGRTIPGEFSNRDLSGVALLDAILNETMRLDNPVCNNAARMTPPEGIVVDGIWIPGGVSVRVPGYALHRSKSPLSSFP